MSHVWSEPHTHGFLRQHTHIYAHAVFTHVHVFTPVHAGKANIAS